MFLRIEKRALSIVMPGSSYSDTCKFFGITPLVDHHRQLCSTFFNTITSDKNHNLFNLLQPRNDPRYSLRNNRAYNIPPVCTNRGKNCYILAMTRQMPPFNKKSRLFFEQIVNMFDMHYVLNKTLWERIFGRGRARGTIL